MGRRAILAVCPGLALVFTATLESNANTVPVKHNTIYVDYDAAASASKSTATGQSGWFVYDLTLTGGSQISDDGTNPAFVTIFDFNGLVAGSPSVQLGSDLTNLGFSTVLTTQGQGIAPAGHAPGADLASVPNLTITFDNADVSKVFKAYGETEIGKLFVRSTFTDSALVDNSVISFDHHFTRSGVVTPNTSTTGTVLPVGSPVSVVPVPLAAWGGLGLFGAMAGAKLRRRMAEPKEE